jgi:hypothetical protein
VSATEASAEQSTKLIQGEGSLKHAPEFEMNGDEKPAFIVSPEEIHFGAIHPGEGVKGIILLRNEGLGELKWSAAGLSGWTIIENQDISGSLENKPKEIRIHVSFLESVSGLDLIPQGRHLYPVQFSIETGDKRFVGRKDMEAGDYRESIQLTSPSGSKTVFVDFKIDPQVREPQISVAPTRLDFGIIPSGQQFEKKIRISNLGNGILKWRIRDDAGSVMDESLMPRRGRYISFCNEDVKGRGFYIVPVGMKDSLEISGRWLEEDGFPLQTPTSGTMKFRFTGYGFSLFIWRGPDAGLMSIYVDDAILGQYECKADRKVSAEIVVAENMVDGPHTVMLTFGQGRLTIEGVRIYGPHVKTGKTGWMTVVPDSGEISKQVNFVNIRMDTKGIGPGVYTEPVCLTSNGGDSIIEVSVEINNDKLSKEIDIYRFIKGRNYLFSANPQAEAKRLHEYGYRKQGIAFRLFPKGTPGTTPFYRWYNARLGCHFYAYEGKAKMMNLSGYTMEGEIGNIATSKLTGTKELYRWYHPSKRCYFFTTDPKGEDVAKKGYKFDGIAGYVK